MKKNYCNRTVIVLVILLFQAMNFIKAQDTIKQPTITLGDQIKLKLSGYVRTDIYYDTRRNVEKVDGLFCLHPMNASYDATNKDINEIGIYRMTATASRIGTRFTGPDLMKAKSSAFIEFDFTGYSGVGASLRHAYVKLSWQKHEVMFGRFFHPMYNLETSPTVIGINSGAPFLIYARNEQLRYTWKPGIINIMLAASALMNYSFPADGAGGYQHYQTMPDLTGNIQLKNNAVTLGISGNYKMNQPKVCTNKTATKTYETSEQVSSYTLMSYAMVKTGKLIAKAGIVYGQANNELNMLGGFAVASRDTATMKEKYTTINNLNYWFNILYGVKIQGGLFVGYSQNLGTSAQTITEIQKDAARGFDANGNGIDHLFRISSSISYKTGPLQLSAELEFTTAAFGKYNINDHAKVSNTKDVTNIRTMITAFYFF
jgi:hypothetical protein